MDKNKRADIIDKIIEKLKAFSLVELIISLVAISIILAAFAPQISKKLSGNGLTIGGVSFGQCDKFGDDCSICAADETHCVVCRKELDGCPDGTGVYNPTCGCESCQYYLSGTHKDKCLSCRIDRDGIGTCKKCEQGYYVDGGTCMPCPDGYYCQNGRDHVECPGGYYCENLAKKPAICADGTYSEPRSSRCTPCPTRHYSDSGASECTECSRFKDYGAGCDTCGRHGCESVESSAYYLRDRKSHACNAIPRCEQCNSAGCSKCSSGHYLASLFSCPTCGGTGGIGNCSRCSQYGAVCTECSNGFYLQNSTSCMHCNDISGCSACSHSSRACTGCSAGHYLKSSTACPSCGDIRGCMTCSHYNNSGCVSCHAGHGFDIVNRGANHFTHYHTLNGHRFYCTEYSSISTPSQYDCIRTSFYDAGGSPTPVFSYTKTTSYTKQTNYDNFFAYNVYNTVTGRLQRSWLMARCNRGGSTRMYHCAAGQGRIEYAISGYHFCKSPIQDQYRTKTVQYGLPIRFFVYAGHTSYYKIGNHDVRMLNFCTTWATTQGNHGSYCDGWHRDPATRAKVYIVSYSITHSEYHRNHCQYSFFSYTSNNGSSATTTGYRFTTYSRQYFCINYGAVAYKGVGRVYL